MSTLRRLLRDERGFTLAELLVATSIGVGVLLVVGTLSTAFLHAQTRVSDRSESIARGRTAMEQIVQELRSQVCLGPGYPAVTYAGDSQVTFYADLANTTFVPEQRDLTFSAGALTERTYPGTATGGQPPFRFASTPSRTRVVLDRLQLQRDSSGTTIPFFRYYSFDNNDPIRPANLLTTPLIDSDEARIVQISISFAALPSRGGGLSGQIAEPFNANVYLRTADPSDPEHSPLCI
jgi:type II secretory pathway pseudopilin PulG